MGARMKKTFCLGLCCFFLACGIVRSQPAGELASTVLEVAKELQVIADKSTVLKMSRPIIRTSISKPEVADVTVLSPTQVMVAGKMPGTCQIIFWDDEEQAHTYDVTVVVDLTEIQRQLDKALPGSRVKAQPIRSNIMLMGTVTDAVQADRAVKIATMFAGANGMVQNFLQVAGEQQVMIQVRVCEVSRSAVRRLGINFLMFNKNLVLTQSTGGLMGGTIGVPADMNMTDPGFFRGQPFFTIEDMVPTASANVMLGLPRAQIQSFIQALADNSLLKILAEPTLVCLSGKQASFLAGGEFPIPVVQEGGAITIEFKEYGVRLSFVATVLGRSHIRLYVSPEVSELDFSNAVVVGGFAVPALIQRRADTTLEMTSGQTFAIAGLLSESTRTSKSRVPGLGDIPILGALFGSRQFQKQQTELVIMVTPQLVAPLNPDQTPLPLGHDIHEPNDWDFFGLGKLEGEESKKIYMQRRSGGANAEEGFPPHRLMGPWGTADYEEAR